MVLYAGASIRAGGASRPGYGPGCLAYQALVLTVYIERGMPLLHLQPIAFCVFKTLPARKRPCVTLLSLSLPHNRFVVTRPSRSLVVDYSWCRCFRNRSPHTGAGRVLFDQRWGAQTAMERPLRGSDRERVRTVRMEAERRLEGVRG